MEAVSLLCVALFVEILRPVKVTLSPLGPEHARPKKRKDLSSGSPHVWVASTRAISSSVLWETEIQATV